MRPGGRWLPSAQIAASKVIHSREPSWRDALTSFDSHLASLKILLLLPITPIKKPFSSILYVFEGSTSYWLTLSTRRSKYSLYFASESALWRTASMPAVHREVR